MTVILKTINRLISNTIYFLAFFGMFPVAEGGRKLTNDVGRSPESFAVDGTTRSVASRLHLTGTSSSIRPYFFTNKIVNNSSPLSLYFSSKPGISVILSGLNLV